MAIGANPAILFSDWSSKIGPFCRNEGYVPSVLREKRRKDEERGILLSQKKFFLGLPFFSLFLATTATDGDGADVELRRKGPPANVEEDEEDPFRQAACCSLLFFLLCLIE